MEELLRLYEQANPGRHRPKTLSLSERGHAGIRVLQRHFEEILQAQGFAKRVGESEAIEHMIDQYIKHVVVEEKR